MGKVTAITKCVIRLVEVPNHGNFDDLIKTSCYKSRAELELKRAENI